MASACTSISAPSSELAVGLLSMLGRFQSIRRNCRVTNVTDDSPSSLLHCRYSSNGNFRITLLSLMAGGAALIPRRHPCRQGRSVGESGLPRTYRQSRRPSAYCLQLRRTPCRHGGKRRATSSLVASAHGPRRERLGSWNGTVSDLHHSVDNPLSHLMFVGGRPR